MNAKKLSAGGTVTLEHLTYSADLDDSEDGDGTPAVEASDTVEFKECGTYIMVTTLESGAAKRMARADARALFAHLVGAGYKRAQHA